MAFELAVGSEFASVGRGTLELMWIRNAGKVRALALRGGFHQVLNKVLLVPELKY